MAEEKKQAKFDAEGALNSGVPEDQVLDYLVKTSKTPKGTFNVEEAVKGGATKRQIIDYLAGTPVDKSGQDGWWENFSRTLNPMPALRLAGKAMLLRNPAYAASEEGKKVPGELYEGFVKPNVDLAKQAGGELLKGDLMGASTHGMLAAWPGVGPAIAEGEKQIGEGNVSGGLGTWSGVLTQIFLPKLAGKAVSKVARGAAPGVYKAGLSFGDTVPLDTREQIVSRGLGREVPKAIGETPESGTVANRKGMDEARKRIAATKPRQMAEINRATAAGIQTIDRDYIVQPLYDLADRYDNAGGGRQAKVLRDVADEFKSKHANRWLSPDDVQKLKEDTDTLLSGKDFGDKELTGQKLGHEMKRDRMRSSLEQVAPVVEQMNWAMHLDESLRTAIEKALKKDKGFFEKISPYMLGAAAESGISLLHQPQWYGHVILAGLILKESLKNPQLMSSVGIALDKAGVAIPKTLGKVAKYGPPLMLNPTARDEEMSDSGPTPPPGGEPAQQPGPPEVFRNPWR